MAIYPFDHDHGEPARELVDLLGGKGAGLAEMTRTLGIRVPPGFTVSLPVCHTYRKQGWPSTLDDDLARHVSRLGEIMGRYLGDPSDPLLLAVRSGAPISMPGMLDTVLNLGLNDETVIGLAERSGDPWFAWDSYRRFLTMFATTVMDVPADRLESGPSGETAEAVREHVARLHANIAAAAGRKVPADPIQQLHEAVEAVFRSWDSDRARAYRTREKISEDLGTAVNVQAMVFGNRGPASGTGVVFTRDPSTGEPGPYGDYLPQAQGEDVVAGTAHTLPIHHLREHQPAAYDELLTVLRQLEIHYRDVCDVEFTLEEGHLWLLQTRVGKRGSVAAVRIAVDLVDDADIALPPAEAITRVPAEVRQRARAEVLDRCSGSAALPEVTGLGASPGRVSGKVVLRNEDAADAEDDVILVRAETSPEDVAGMGASAGILTTSGGLVSHAAVVARGWGIPAVVGAQTLKILTDGIQTTDGTVVRVGETITIDGSTGGVWVGAVTNEVAEPERVLADELPHLARLDAWAQNDTTINEESTHMKIAVDYNRCTSLGICESLAPDFFEVDDEGNLQLLRDDIPEDQRGVVEQAVANCPTVALSIVENS